MHDIVIHGHFYQPPREDPWLELVPHELSASPDHDWNERINRQCYAPMARIPVMDETGRITRLINAYAWCSYDIGPSLFRWFDHHAPNVAASIIAGDRESTARTGAGNAIAMPYHHAILPLMSRRDKVTEVRWGIRDFRARFKREPVGMWLPETAADHETLGVLADERIAFTILAPGQVQESPPYGRPGRWTDGARSLAVFVYDGPSAHQVAFGGALDNATEWEANLNAFPVSGDGGPNIVSIATDGETFGHHHAHGERTLAALIDRIRKRGDARITNYAALLAKHTPQFDVTLISPSSWSCPHGVGRWERACGCHYEVGTQQEWRAPLRHGLATLNQGITAIIERDWPASAGDIWTARDVAGPDLTGAAQLPPEAKLLLEVEQHALAMFTSCAWFFDDIGRLEPRIVLRHAARALELLPIEDQRRLENELVATLAFGQSNDPAKGNGADIWHRDVVPDANGPSRLAAAIGALRELAPEALDVVQMPTHYWRTEGDVIVLVHRRTGIESRWFVSPIVAGILATRAEVRPMSGGPSVFVSIAAYPEPIRTVLREIATPIVLDAALSSVDRDTLRAGLLDTAATRDCALAGAWALVRRDGVDDAGIVVHGVLDLLDLDGVAATEAQRSLAFSELDAQPATDARSALALRFGLAL